MNNYQKRAFMKTLPILVLTTLFLLTSCGQGGKIDSSQSVSFTSKKHGSLSLPEEDVHLLKVHSPDLLKKIRGPLAMTIDDIITLQRLGFTSDIVIMIINYTDSHFQLATADILRLQAEGVPFKVINYMIRT